jgi:hypothetical protein
MRTTVDIPDATYRKLKAEAARRGCSVRALILRGVEKQLGPEGRARRRVRLPIVRSKEPGALRITNAQIYDIMPFP